MDPIVHTVLAVGLMWCAYFVGKLFGKQQGINAAVAFLLHTGATTEAKLKEANDLFENQDR